MFEKQINDFSSKLFKTYAVVCAVILSPFIASGVYSAFFKDHSDTERTKTVLTSNENLRDVEITGGRFSPCFFKGGDTATQFKAVTAEGAKTSGTLCIRMSTPTDTERKKVTVIYNKTPTTPKSAREYAVLID